MKQPPRSRPSFTLLEMVLVVAIMGIVLGLGIPSYQNYRRDVVVRAAADSVRTALTSARARAMDEGRPYRFAVVPGQGYYRVAPDNPAYWSGGGNPSGDDPDNPPLILEDVLPERIRFQMGNDNGADPGDGPSPDSVNPSQYVTTAVLNPDGTAQDDVSITLRKQGTAPLVVSVRSLTGIARVRKTTGEAIRQ
jgi:prepilin-type N-terminal cleavage/methylation domain-containing protein